MRSVSAIEQSSSARDQMGYGDAALPSFLFELRQQLSPEKMLMVAVLADAVYCVTELAMRAGVDNQRVAEEAFCWFLSRRRDSLYSFENICDVLRFDAECGRAVMGARYRAAKQLRGQTTAPGRPLRVRQNVRTTNRCRVL